MGNIDVGRIGESIAASYLELTGRVILARNFRIGHLEVDLIVQDGDCTSFIEVKTRRSGSFGGAIDSISKEKVRNLKKAAMFFMSKHRYRMSSENFRIDIIAIDVDGDRGRLALEHLKGII